MTVLPLLLDQLHQLDLPYAAECDDRLLVSILLALAQPTATPPQTRAILVRLYTDDNATNDDKEEAVGRTAREVAWICTVIFALTAHTVSCTPAQSAQAFLRALFPSETGPEPNPSSQQQRDSRPARQEREAGEPTAPRRRSLPRRRSSVPLAISVQAANDRSLQAEEEIRTPTRLPRRASRSNSQDASSPLSQDQFFDAAIFSNYTGPNPEDGDSSAGEDLYPTSTSPTATSFRSAAMSRRIGSADSVSVAGSSRPRSSERRRSSARGRRRYSVSSPTRSRAVSRTSATEGIGLGLATPTRIDDSRPGLNNGRRPSGTTSRRRSDSTDALASSRVHADPPSSSALPPHMQPASYLQQAERRPSIASIQTAMQDSSIASTSRPATSAEQTPIAQERRTPLSTRPSSPSISFASPPASPPRSRKASGIANLGRRGSSTYPPLQPARIDPASNGSSPSSTTNTAAFAPKVPAQNSSDANHTRALPQVLIVENLERARPSVQDELLAVLRDRRVTVSSQHGEVESGPTASSRAAPAVSTDSLSRLGAGKPTAEVHAQYTGVPSDSPHDPAFRRRQAEKQNGSNLVLETREAETWNLPDDFLCVAIMCVPDERGSRARTGRDIVSRYLLDRFCLSYSLPLETVLASDSHFSLPALHPLSAPTQALFHPIPVPKDALPDYISDSLDTYLSDLVSAIRHHPRLDARMLTARAVKDLRRMTRLWAALTKGEGSLRLGEPASTQTRATDPTYQPATASSKSTRSSASSTQDGSLIVLPADVLAVLVSVLSHRLTVRDPRHEASLFWGSTIEALEARHRADQATVEDLIREVVAVV